MKYTYIILLTAILIQLQLSGTDLPTTGIQGPRIGGRIVEYRLHTRNTASSSGNGLLIDAMSNIAATDAQYGLHYNQGENSWTLYVTILQLKKTSVYGYPGEIAQIEYSLDGELYRNGWIVLRIDDYFFVDEASKVGDIKVGQNLRLFINGDYVSAKGVDWEKCPRGDIYCMNAGFVEGGFPKSEDYDGLMLCPANTLIRSGFLPDDWINGMLAWKVGT